MNFLFFIKILPSPIISMTSNRFILIKLRFFFILKIFEKFSLFIRSIIKQSSKIKNIQTKRNE